MASNSQRNDGPAFSFSGTPTITSEKLNAKNYLAWSASVELWFLGQGFHEHLEKTSDDISEDKRDQWKKLDYQLCALLWQSVEPTILTNFRTFKTCHTFWKKAQNVFANDIQQMYDAAQKLATLKQVDHNMVAYVSKAQSAVEELKLSLEADKLEDIKKKLDNLYMVLILRGMHPDFDHVRDQVLTGQEVPSLENLITRLLRVPSSIGGNSVNTIETSAMISSRGGRGGRGNRGGRGGRGGRPQCSYCKRMGHTQDTCYSIHGFPRKFVNISKSETSEMKFSEAEYQEYLRLKAAKEPQISSSIGAHNSAACISQSGNDQNPWIIDSGASDHIAGNSSLFSSISSPNIPHFITLADGSQVTAKGIGHVSPTSSLSLSSVLFIPNCPFNLISLSQLTRSHNYSVTFDANSFVIQERGTGRTIGVGHESNGLYYLKPDSSWICSVAASPKLLHERLGHPHLSKLKIMVPGLEKIKSFNCESCQLGKHVRSSFKHAASHVDSLFSVIHSDIWGPSRVSSLGYRYFITFIDEFSRCTWVFLMKDRSEIVSIITSFVNEIKTQFGKTIKVLRSDNAKEYFSSAVSSFLSSQGILHQSSCPHTPQQNGIAERKNRHIVETARTLLLHANVPVHHWGDAILTACFLINRMPSSSIENKIPHSILFPKEPLFHIDPRIFGCTCFVHDMSPGLDKLSARAIKCVFLGYSRLQKGYRCYSPVHNRYYISADVTFFEEKLYFLPSTVESKTLQEVFPIPYLGPSPPLQESRSIIDSSDIPENLPPEQPQRPLITYQRRPQIPNTELEGTIRPAESCPTPADNPATDLPEENLAWPIALRKGIRSTRNPHPIYNFLSYHRLSPSFYSFVSSLSSVSIPKNLCEALDHPGWRQAMIDEMQALEHNGTWELVPLPPGKKPVGCRWVYTVKVAANGQIDRLKARLVAKGYTQIYGLDYGDTFSPVAKIASVRLFLAIAAINHWPLYQLDIKNAFLHGELEEEIYMEQPPGFVAQGESGLVCKLQRSLYGLKQSPRAWFGKFSSVVQAFGMKRSEADHSVFYCHTSPGRCVYLVVYVDDIVITGNDPKKISQLKEHLFSHFQTKDLGKLKYFLGIEVAQSENGIIISQRKYALDILKETSMLDCKPADSPMDPNLKLLPNQGETYSNPERYRRLVGKLIYLTITRPDISFAVGVVSQFMQSPHNDHWDAVIRILRYIKRTPGQGLLYEDKGSTQIVGFCDADWAGSPIDRCSTSGYCVSIGGNLVSWKSKKQNVVARSSAEAEYRAMAVATCELIWIKQILQELKFGNTQQMKLCCDNQAALHIASNPVFHERTKHIEIDCHFVREKVLSKEVITKSISSNDQLADIFTKSLRGPRIQNICSKLGAFDLYAPS